jgi:hypothetical protein
MVEWANKTGIARPRVHFWIKKPAGYNIYPHRPRGEFSQNCYISQLEGRTNQGFAR